MQSEATWEDPGFGSWVDLNRLYALSGTHAILAGWKTGGQVGVGGCSAVV